MTVFEWIGIIALATVVAWVLVECCRAMPSRPTGWTAPMSAVSMINRPPRIGGIALLFMSGAGLLLFSPSGAISLIWILALLMGLVTLFDDRFELPRLLRFGIQTIVASIAVVAYSGIFISGGFPLLGNALPSWALVVMVLIWIVGLTNAYNFMDGIDGIAAIQGIVVVLGWSSISVATSGSEASDWILMTLLLGALLGFLAHNWSPARIFMGDGGSTFLGFLFALFPVAFAAAGRMELERALEAGFLFLWPFIFDTSTAFVRRVWKREPVFTAHRSHLYQVLAATYATRSGGHRITAAIYGGLSLIGIGLYWTPGPLWAKIGVCAWLWLALAAWTYGIRAEKIKVTTIDKKGKNKAHWADSSQ
jgi:UDP-N-acetylmuramyl pentapeptide phosphotransferase/UDP-N-acetylglucosamine-1-phosphate transferase